ncbi:RNA polymerase sigma factor [Streptomyces sp. NPDC051016]|uniref:RNA polymerase sigma factor n=1 Tax=Streptomyces sp. NPDC051016 TaxID=3365638 RepID=UPI0037B51B04
MTDRQQHKPPERLSPEAAADLERLFRAHRTRLIAYARLNGVDLNLAEDIASETWIAVISRLNRGALTEGPGLPRLFGMMVRSAVSAHFRVARNRELPVAWWADGTTDTVFPHAATVEQELAEPYDGPEFPARIRQALDHLPETWRQSLEFHCEGLTYAAAASHLGLSQVRVREIVKAASKAMRPVLEGAVDDPDVPQMARWKNVGVRRTPARDLAGAR